MQGAARWDIETASRIIDEKRGLDGAALPILHALQDHFGYIDKAAIPLIAEALNLSKAEIHGIVSFYHDFRPAPAHGEVLKLCRAESCQAMGCEALVAHLASAHRIEPDKPRVGAALHVETVYCLGNCALSPAALLNGDPIGRLTPAKLDGYISAAAARSS